MQSEGPIETSAVGLPMNAYTMGYYDGLYGTSVSMGMVGSKRYMAGWNAGSARWSALVALARGEG